MTSVERYDLANTHRVQYADGALRPFLRDRLFLDVFQSLSHRKTALQDAKGLTDTIISDICSTTRRGVFGRRDIIEVTTTVLHRFDKVASTHYSARHFS